MTHNSFLRLPDKGQSSHLAWIVAGIVLCINVLKVPLRPPLRMLHFLRISS